MGGYVSILVNFFRCKISKRKYLIKFYQLIDRIQTDEQRLFLGCMIQHFFHVRG